jgi:ribosomal protein L31
LIEIIQAEFLGRQQRKIFDRRLALVPDWLSEKFAARVPAPALGQTCFQTVEMRTKSAKSAVLFSVAVLRPRHPCFFTKTPQQTKASKTAKALSQKFSGFHVLPLNAQKLCCRSYRLWS